MPTVASSTPATTMVGQPTSASEVRASNAVSAAAAATYERRDVRDRLVAAACRKAACSGRGNTVRATRAATVVIGAVPSRNARSASRRAAPVLAGRSRANALTSVRDRTRAGARSARARERRRPERGDHVRGALTECRRRASTSRPCGHREPDGRQRRATVPRKIDEDQAIVVGDGGQLWTPASAQEPRP